MSDLQALFAAIRAADLPAVRRLIESAPALVAEPGPHPIWGGRLTALHLAVENGRADVVRILLDAGADPNHPSTEYDGWTPLLLAAERDPSLASLLQARGAHMDAWEAAAYGDVDRLTNLLGANPALVHARRTNTAPPLHFAKNVPIASLLVDRGADLLALDKYGSTAARTAAYSRADRRDVARFLMARSGERDPWLLAALGDIDGLRALAGDGVDVARARRLGINPASGFGETPMHTASALGNVGVVEFLLSQGADPNASGAQGAGPLHYAARHGSRELVELLMRAGADIDARDDEHGGTPADWAAFFGHPELVPQLVRRD
jgi:ankyrin repeat protein